MKENKLVDTVNPKPLTNCEMKLNSEKQQRVLASSFTKLKTYRLAFMLSRNILFCFQGKYVEIQFSRGGEPIGGQISNFLLEKVTEEFISL